MEKDLHNAHPPQPRPEALATPAAAHGALDYVELERLGIAPHEVLDFSVNSNPFGPSPAVREALLRVPLDHYPDREALALRRALAAHLRVDVEQIVVGNGTAELLWLTALAYIPPGAGALVIGPTFGEYARAARLMGARVHEWTARPEEGFAVVPRAVEEALRAARPKVVFLCHPNNPTGVALDLDHLARWAGDWPETLFVVDEAYLAFAAGCPSALSLGAPNVLVLRSMTKDYALAGLRLGYAVGPRPLVEALARVRPPWNVNALAQAAGLAALGDPLHLHRTLGALAEAAQNLAAGLRGLGLEVCPSCVHFFLVNVGDGAALRAALLRHGILVRDAASFGLPQYVRIATRRPHENARLLTALREVTRCRT